MLADWQTQLAEVLLLPRPQSAKFGVKRGITLPAEMHALQGLDLRRLALYQELMLNTLLESAQSIFPYTYQLLSRNGHEPGPWQALVETYRRAYPNKSHKLMDAVESFPRFLGEQAQWMRRYPFLNELALYEWLEMQVINLPDAELVMDLPGELPKMEQFSACAPVWNAAHQLQQFEFPIPELIDNLQKQSQKKPKALSQLEKTPPQPTAILIYRDPNTLEVRFFTLNALTSALFQLSIAQPEASYDELLRQLRELVPALQAMPEETVQTQAAGLFRSCLENGSLLGSRRL